MRSAEPPLARVIGASHAAIDVSDIDRSVEFYTRVLGLEIFHDDRAQGVPPNIKGMIGRFTIELAQGVEAKAAGGGILQPPPGAPCIAFAVQDALGAFARLRARGVATGPRVNEIRGVRFFYVYDPDGYPFELIEFPDGETSLGELRARYEAGADS